MIIIIKNKTASDIFVSDVGQVFASDSSSTINPTQYPYFASSQEIVPYIVNGSLVVNDTDYDLSPRVGLAILQNNEQVINEYYTLTDDWGILVGNGRILQSHEDNWELDDTGEVDDNPTQEWK